MEAVSPLSALTAYNRVDQAAGVNGTGAGASEEFLTVFYKEMLKEAIKAPSFSYDPEENSDANSFFTAYNTDIMIEQFAKQLAKNQLASPGGLLAGQTDQAAQADPAVERTE